MLPVGKPRPSDNHTGSSALIRAAAVGMLLLLVAGAAPHTASDPPDLNSAAALLSWDKGAGELSWYYAHPGDYNQDGLVTVSDITPLGQNFGAEGPFAEDSALSVIDGNSDGFITVSDITPIGQNFGKSLETYEAFHSDSTGDYPASNTAPNGGGATLLGTVQLVNVPLLTGKRRHFVLTLGASAPTDGFGWVRPLDAEQHPGTPSNMIEFTNGGGPVNTPPVASLVLSVSDVPPNSEVTLDASASTDVDGDELSFSFDPEGDGSFLTPSAQDSLSWTYYTLGELSPAVRVDDGNGATDEASAALEVSLGTLEKHIIDAVCEPEQTSWKVSLVMSGDRPGVVYYDAGAELGYTVRWRYPLTPSCDSWGDQRGVAKGYQYISATPLMNKVAVAYADGSDILFTRCVNADGSGDWEAPRIIADASEICDTFLVVPSLAVINGNPAMVCVSADGLIGGDLFYNRAAMSSGFNWPTATELISATTDVIGTSSLCEVYSRPSIAYVTDTAFKGEIMFWRADDENGDSWTEGPVEVRPEARYALSDTSLRMVINRPTLVYYSHVTDEVCYVRARDTYGTAWGEPVTIDSDTSANGSMDLAVINGLPTIAYHKQSVGLCCAVAKDDKGESWNEPVVVDADAGVGVSVKIAEVDGHIAFAYHNTYRENVEFAVYR